MIALTILYVVSPGRQLRYRNAVSNDASDIDRDQEDSFKTDSDLEGLEEEKQPSKASPPKANGKKHDKAVVSSRPGVVSHIILTF